MVRGEEAFAFRLRVRLRAPRALGRAVGAAALVGSAACGPPKATLDLEADGSASGAVADGAVEASDRAPSSTQRDGGADDDGQVSTTGASLDACLRGCERRLPDGVSKLRPVFACAELRCYAPCVAFETPDAAGVGDAAPDVDGGAPVVCRDVGEGPGKFTWFDAACDACLVDACCPVVTACTSDPSCDALNQCQDACYAPAAAPDAAP